MHESISKLVLKIKLKNVTLAIMNHKKFHIKENFRLRKWVEVNSKIISIRFLKRHKLISYNEMSKMSEIMWIAPNFNINAIDAIYT